MISKPAAKTRPRTSSSSTATCSTVATYYKVEANTDKVKLDKQHRTHRWINKTEDDLHPYLVEMIKNTGLFRE